MPQQVYLSNIQKFSTHDGPGVRTNVFFKGCPMRCKWCANPETIEPYPQLMLHKNKCTGCGHCAKVCPSDAIRIRDKGVSQVFSKCKACGKCIDVCLSQAREIIGKLVPPEEAFREIEQDEVFYLQKELGGVTFSGGEPLLHPDYIEAVASKCKEKGYSVAVETCGYFDIERAGRIIPLIDLFLFDLKIMDDAKHIKYCGQSNKKILKNFDVIAKLGNVLPRVPIIPGVNDGIGDLLLLCEFLSNYRGKISELHILPYHNLALSKYDALDIQYEMRDVRPPDDAHMNAIKKMIEGNGFKVVIGG